MKFFLVFIYYGNINKKKLKINKFKLSRKMILQFISYTAVKFGKLEKYKLALQGIGAPN